MDKLEIKEWFNNELINEMFPKTSKEFWQYYASEFQQELDTRIFDFNRLLAKADEMLGNLKSNFDLLEKYGIDLMTNPLIMDKRGNITGWNATLFKRDSAQSVEETEELKELYEYYVKYYKQDERVNIAIAEVDSIVNFLHTLYGDLQQAGVLDNPEYATLVDMYTAFLQSEQGIAEV